MKREWTKKIGLKPFVLLCTTALGLTASATTYTWTGGADPNSDGSYKTYRRKGNINLFR